MKTRFDFFKAFCFEFEYVRVQWDVFLMFRSLKLLQLIINFDIIFSKVILFNLQSSLFAFLYQDAKEVIKEEKIQNRQEKRDNRGAEETNGEKEKEPVKEGVKENDIGDQEDKEIEDSDNER